MCMTLPPPIWARSMSDLRVFIYTIYIQCSLLAMLSIIPPCIAIFQCVFNIHLMSIQSLSDWWTDQLTFNWLSILSYVFIVSLNDHSLTYLLSLIPQEQIFYMNCIMFYNLDFRVPKWNIFFIGVCIQNVDI